MQQRRSRRCVQPRRTWSDERCLKFAKFAVSIRLPDATSATPHRVTNRVFRPNIQKITIKDKEGRVRKANVCTSCMKAGEVERA